ncbi:uncharacterized protein LOC144650609 [Oculina patagonica]
MSLPQRKDSTPAGYDRSLFLRWNRLQMNAMEDSMLQELPTTNKMPKITSQARLIVGARRRIADAESSLRMENDKKRTDGSKELVKMSETSESAVKKVDIPVKVLPTVVDVRSEKSNPFEFFKQHRFDKELDLNGWFLGPITAFEISSELFSSSSIVRLFLANNRLGNEGGKAVAKGLEKNFSVRELDLSENMLGQNAIASIGEMLNKNQTLEKLNLSRNGLTDADVEDLLESLCGKTVLKELDLSRNILCDQFAEQMSNVLINNFTLEKLSISSNQLEVTGLQAMLPGLLSAQTLSVLNISWNYLYDVGAEILGELIADNRSLIEISACGNFFTSKAASFLAKGVANNPKLKVLRIGQNLIRNSGAYSFINVLSESKSPSTVLEILDINGTIVDRKFQKLVTTGLPEKFSSLKVVNFSVVDEISNELEPFVEKSPDEN